jgi:hypothetical protein
MRKIVIFVVVLFLMGTCQEKPSYVLNDKKMVDMLVDIHIADVMYRLKSLPPRYEEADTALYTDIFNKYKVSKKQFDTVLNYYITHNPEKLKIIYDSVINRLSFVEGEIEEAREKEKEEKEKK